MSNKEWDDMREVWMADGAGAPAVSEVVEYVQSRADRFDKRVKRRNWIEWVGCVLLVVVVGSRLSHAEEIADMARGLSVMAYAVWVAIYIWRYGRVEAAPDPSLSRVAYRDALREKFSKQVRLLKSVKYWYILPVPILASVSGAVKIGTAMTAGESIVRPATILVGIYAFCLFVWWLNESWGVRKIEREWDRVRTALDEGVLPEERSPKLVE